MKKLLAVTLLFLASVPAFAQHHHHHHGHWGGPRYYPSYGWVAPTIIGGVIGYEIARNQQTVVVQQPQVIVQQGQNCTPWREVQQPDGTIYRERTCQ
jgi:hypothetical protein